MNKEKFLNSLRKRLNVLEDKEIEDIISEYAGYIDEKVNAGLTEEEAVSELGNIDEIVSDLLAAYKVKEPNNNDGIINKISNAIDNFMDSFEDKSAKDVLKILIEIIIMLLFIWFLKIPFNLIRDLGENIFEGLLSPVGNILSSIWWIIIEVSYVIVSIIFFCKMFEKRYFKDISAKIIAETENDINEEKAQKKSKESKKDKEVVEVKSPAFTSTLTSICLFILKFFALIFVISLIFYQIGISIALSFMIYLICKGVTYFGVLILLIALFMGGAFLLKNLINFIFNIKVKVYRLFTGLVVCIITLAVGLTLTGIEVSNTEIIYEPYHKEMQTKIQEIAITSDYMPIYNYDNIIIDNTIKDKIKIEYSYPKISDLSYKIELEDCGSGYCLYDDIEYFKWSKKTLNYVIDILKAKKIPVYDFKVVKKIYVNESDLNKIKAVNEPQTFTKIYKVLNVLESNAEYVYLTLQDEDDIQNVHVLKSLAPNIEPNNWYEFTFSSTSDYDDDLNEIFRECKLLKITQFGDISFN